MQPTEVVGKVRFIASESDLSSIEEGDIVVIQRLPENGYTHFKKAAAIVSAEGGMFSHAAIIFSEMGVPALTGSSLQSLIQYNGKFIHLNLSEASHLKSLSDDETALLQNSQLLTLEAAHSIESLSGTIKQVVSKQFYKRLFNTLSTAECKPFLEYPSAQAYLEEQKQEMGALKKTLWSTENAVHRSYLLGKMNRLKEQLFSLEILSLEELTKLDGEIASLSGERTQNRFAERSGKLENLEQLRPLMANMQPSNEITFEIPSFISFKAEELAWRHHPSLQQEVGTILDSSAEAAQKSASIGARLKDIAIDEQTVLSQWNTSTNAPWIVRSSSHLEDQATSSGAGIFDSVSGNDRSKIGGAIRQVLASGFSEAALSYLLPHTATEKLFDMQFILQDYIADADYSGVAFSVKDEQQWDVAAMQVVSGVGGGVDGSQNPSYLFFDTSAEQFVEIDSKKLPCKTAAAKEIATFVKKLEAHFGIPVEIEFAGKGNRIFVVQVRPITRYCQ